MTVYQWVWAFFWKHRQYANSTPTSDCWAPREREREREIGSHSTTRALKWSILWCFLVLFLLFLCYSTLWKSPVPPLSASSLWSTVLSIYFLHWTVPLPLCLVQQLAWSHMTTWTARLCRCSIGWYVFRWIWLVNFFTFSFFFPVFISMVDWTWQKQKYMNIQMTKLIHEHAVYGSKSKTEIHAGIN